MHPVRVNGVAAGHGVQVLQHPGGRPDAGSGPGQTEAIAAVVDSYAEALLNMAQVFVELATEVGKPGVVGRLENDLVGIYGESRPFRRFF